MFLLVPGFAAAQADSRSHIVVEGETLWGLAERYCGDAFRWPEIFQANRSEIADPNLILPDQVLAIACAADGGEVLGVEIVTPEPDRGPVPPFNERAVRTVFHRDLSSSIGQMMTPDVLVMSRDASWSASWLQLGAQDPWSSGRVAKLLSGRNARNALPYHRVRVESDAEVSLGDIFQLFRSTRLIEGLGRVLTPTGMMSVTSTEAGGFEGVVLKSYGPISEGDLVVPAPGFDLEPGEVASAVSSQATAQILAFGEVHAIHQLGDIALLDMGSSDGVALGDEYVLITDDGDGWTGQIVGRLQIVRVTEETASARLVQINMPDFQPGLQVRLDRKMR